MIDSLTSSEY